MYPARCRTAALIFTSWVAIRTDGPRLECSIRIWPRSRPSTTATLNHNHNHHAQSNKVRRNMPPCCCCCDWDARRKTQLHFLTLVCAHSLATTLVRMPVTSVKKLSRDGKVDDHQQQPPPLRGWFAKKTDVKKRRVLRDMDDVLGGLE
jgi:hypothetical protein